jgi:serine/threonine protein kinase
MSHSIQTECPSCRQLLLLDADHVGALVKCATCQTAFAALKFKSVSNNGGSGLMAILVTDEPEESTETSSRETLDVASESASTTVSGEWSQKRIGRYELKKLLGQGGFGKVYLAFDPDLERVVALKVLTLGLGQKNRIQRFLIEAKAAARLKHPNIVPTYVSGQADGRYFIASEFIEGELLSKRLKRQTYSPAQAARIVRKLATALAYAHENDVVHRDVKPHNIMIDQRGEPHLMDFGLAKRVDDDSKVTSDGSVLGTPAYMSPEQARGEVSSVGPASDQYSLAVVLFQMLTGSTPFQGPPHLVIADVARGNVPPVSSLCSDLSRDLAAVCDRALRSEPEDRYASCEDFAADLGNWLEKRPVTARPLTTYQELSRYLAQHKIIASFTAAILTLLLLTMISLGVIWKRAKQRELGVGANVVTQDDARSNSQNQSSAGISKQQQTRDGAQKASANSNVAMADSGEVRTDHLSAVPDGKSVSPSTSSPPAEVMSLAVGQLPPEINAADWLNTNSPASLESLRGKTVLVEFWATWCGPCIAGIPHLNQMQKKYQDKGFRILSLTAEDRETVEAFQKGRQAPIEYTVGLGSESSKTYGVNGIPAAFLIGTDGKLLWNGHPSSTECEEAIAKALGVEFTPSRPSDEPMVAGKALVNVGETMTLAAKTPAHIEALRAKIELAQREVSARKLGHLIIGRVTGSDDVELVNSQMMILPGGFFADATRDLTRPIGFRQLGYRPFDLVIPPDAVPDENGIIDVGTIVMEKADPSEISSAAGSVRLEGGGSCENVRVTFSLSHGPVNTPGNETESRPRWPAMKLATVDSNGVISIDGLTEGEYWVSYSLPGFVSAFRGYLKVDPHQNLVLQPVELEKPRGVSLEFVVAKDSTAGFDASLIRNENFPAGTRWKAGTEASQYGWDLEFSQVRRSVTFNSSYVPCTIADLGEGNLADFLKPPSDAVQKEPRTVSVTSGHVYLLKQGHWKHDVLFRIDISEPAPGNVSVDSSVNVPSVAATLSAKLASFGGRAYSVYSPRDQQSALVINLGEWSKNDANSLPAPALSEAAIREILATDLPVHLTLQGQGPEYSDAAIAQIPEMKQLRTLTIAPRINAVDDSFCQKLSGIPQLQAVSLRSPRITDKGLSSLAGIKTLEYLSLSEALISNTGVKSLENHVYLTRLELSGCRKLTEASITSLQKLPMLQRLILDDSVLTTESTRTLRIARPTLLVGVLGRTPWLAGDAHQANFDANSAVGLRASDVWIRYDSDLKELQCSVEWSVSNGHMYYVKSRLTDEDLETHQATKMAEGYTVARLRSASMNGKRYHIVLWTKDPGTSSPDVSQVGSQSQK